jgi:hypothetical protein
MIDRSPFQPAHIALTLLGLILSLAVARQTYAQGQDTTPWSRDLQVIEVMLPGFYSNANQAYFDGRREVDNPQPRHNLSIEAASHGFTATLSAPDGSVISEQYWSLEADDARKAGTYGHYRSRWLHALPRLVDARRRTVQCAGRSRL